jgi:hypothetical protein
LQQKLSETDYGGTVLPIGSTTSLIIPITWSGVIYSWSGWHTLTPLILVLAGLARFVFFECKGFETPVLSIILFRNLYTTAAYSITYLLGFSQLFDLLSHPLLTGSSRLQFIASRRENIALNVESYPRRDVYRNRCHKNRGIPLGAVS